MRRIVSLLTMLLAINVFAVRAPGADTAQSADAEKVVAKKKLSAAHIELHGSYAEGAGAPGLFGEVVETLGTVLQRLESGRRPNRIFPKGRPSLTTGYARALDSRIL